MIATQEEINKLQITSRLLVEEAIRRGYDIEIFRYPSLNASTLIRGTRNGKEIFFRSLYTGLTPSYGIYAADDKSLSYVLLQRAGVPVPEMVTVDADDFSSGVELIEKYGSVVAKPIDGNHGDGITVGIQTPDQLTEAVTYARAVAKKPDVIVQQMVYGEEYRFLVIGGKVVAVATRRPPTVIGDGVRTVKELVDELNADPRRGEGHIAALTLIDMQDVVHHNPAGFIDQVPAKGESVTVLRTTNLSRGGEATDYTDVASLTLKNMAIAAAESCGLTIAGVDILTHDIAAADTTKSYVLEVNVCPGIRMHQMPSHGTPRDVAAMAFTEIEKTARKIGAKLTHIGRSEKITLPELLGKRLVPARIDTGATVSSIWASNIVEDDGELSFTLFAEGSPHFTGEVIRTRDFSVRTVTSSMGHTQDRYETRMLIRLHKRRVRATFTLADRSAQMYPILIGRNVLRHKFIVNVASGRPDFKAEGRQYDPTSPRRVK